ncbi:Adenosylmethionine-8-amino-7-oxononanoate aminotransferase [Paramagnetospirillum magnetotacticum MS-1]|uniref:Adenosylmethionine-8-amino-7-oxononanoate aminotransferase n=1 Tax=Paramagnetospirillum magnetotacticum MS-1 TaxID=272627 RepID=A0A0C2YWE3_PARME|nr:aspartate aminotransferase family protein [Paramagnetospirillum magnetotacticum]KIL99448.1 Adenosylmethionine-8-amino-7-oxononanoate aminotransferase [Paramagnetospirillum magnetotacticum MS-1]
MPTRASNRTITEKDVDSVLHPYTNLKRHPEVGPLVITRGKGVRVYDEAGKDYIEGLAGLWCTSLGWGEERLVEAAARQMRTLPFYHLFSHKTHDVGVELCARLLEMAPVPMSKVFLAGSGSEANDTAIKLIHYRSNALGLPHKKKIIAREKAYHGVTVATASLTGLVNNQRSFDLPIPGVLRAGCPHHYRFARQGESEEDFSSRLAAELEALILAEGPDTVAAFFAEPVMGAGGVIVPPAGYFPKIQAVLDRYDILLVVDEVICGFGRTGKMFGTETFGIRPDMMTLAKGLSSGYAPISALMVNERVYGPVAEESGRIGVFGHGYTYGGHPVSAAVALETLNIYAERDILAHIAKVGPVLQEGLGSFRDHPLVGEARGIGLIGALELVADKTSRAPFPPERTMGAKVVARAQDKGVILRAMGDAIAFAPPLIITEAEIGDMLRRFKAALDEAHGALGLG